jgi:hypothetical protein
MYDYKTKTHGTGLGFCQFGLVSNRVRVSFCASVLQLKFWFCEPEIWKLMLQGEHKDKILSLCALLRTTCTRTRFPSRVTFFAWHGSDGQERMKNTAAYFTFEPDHLLCSSRPRPLTFSSCLQSFFRVWSVEFLPGLEFMYLPLILIHNSYCYRVSSLTERKNRTRNMVHGPE